MMRVATIIRVFPPQSSMRDEETDIVSLGQSDGTDMGRLGVDIDRVFLGLWVQAIKLVSSCLRAHILKHECN